MDKAKNFGHEVPTCIVVRHLPRLYRSMNTSNGTNGSNSDIIDLHSDVPILNIILNDNINYKFVGNMRNLEVLIYMSLFLPP